MWDSGEAAGSVAIHSLISFVPTGSITEDPIRGMRPDPSFDMRKNITLR